MLNKIENPSIYSVGIYIRLSKDDGTIGESESIINQRDFLIRYLNENALKLYDIYIDDGYSGTNFNRPNFIRMKSDIESKKINMVITKDLSRLGRDYIETGEYLEKYFPMYKVRFIAVTDNIDTLRPESNIDMAPFRAVFNDMYAKDISKKIITALRTKQKEGKWVGGCTPLGYMKDPNNKNHLVINEEEAWIVRKIFLLAKEGNGTCKIRDILIKEKVPTYSLIRNDNRHKNNLNNLWSSKTIRGILKNELYTGDLVQNRRSKLNYKMKKIVNNNEKDWIIVKNTHEAIIDRETYDLVNKIISKNTNRNTKKEIRILDGLLFCFECKRRIGICAPRKNDNRTYTVCNLYRRNSKLNLCTSHSNNYDVLEEKIFDIIKKVCLDRIKKEILEETIKNFIKNNREYNYENKLNILLEEQKKLEENIDKVYMDKIEDKITVEMYERITLKIKKRIEEIKLNVNLIKRENNRDFNILKECNKAMEIFLNNKKIKRKTILRLINKIEIHEDKEIDIYFNFSNF